MLILGTCRLGTPHCRGSAKNFKLKDRNKISYRIRCGSCRKRKSILNAVQQNDGTISSKG